MQQSKLQFVAACLGAVYAIALSTNLWSEERARPSPGLRDCVVVYNPSRQDTGEILRDQSPNCIHGEILGARWVRGETGSALDFDGFDDYVDCGDDRRLRIRSALTLTVWLRTASREQQYVISKYGWNIYLGPDGAPRFETRSADNSAWNTLEARKPVPVNAWAFVAAVYNPRAQRMEIYVDGKLSGAKPRSDGALGRVHRGRLILGRYSTSSSFYFNGLIGETRVYSRSLSAQEIAELYEAGAKRIDRTVNPLPFRIGLRPHLFFKSRELLVDLCLTRCAETADGMKARLRLTRRGDSRPSQEKVIEQVVRGRRFEAVMRMDNLPRGEYVIEARLLDAGDASLTAASATFTLPEEPWWLGSREGITGDVLPPWTPLELREQPDRLTVRCWGRTYSAEGSPFLSEIETAGESVLARPVRLTARVNGKRAEWKSSAIQLRERSDAKIEFSQSAQSEALKLTALTMVEYDGMVRMDWRVEPTRRVMLDELTFEIALREQFAKYLYYYPNLAGPWSDHRPGALPNEGVAMRFNPVLWLGDEERGLEWLCESARNWFPVDESRAIEITREHGAVVLRLHLVGKAIELDPGLEAVGRRKLSAEDSQRIETAKGSLSYTFGLQATPVKPTTKDAWDYRSTCLYTPVYGYEQKGPDGKSGIQRLAEAGVKTLGLMDWTDILCYNLPTEPEKLRDFVKESHKQGVQVLVYFGFQMSERAPEFDAFRDECTRWVRSERFSYAENADNYPPKPTQQVFRVCYRSAWQDFVVAGAARLIDEYDIDGVYLDGTGMPYPCYNVRHGCGYRKPDGTMGPTYSIFDGRRTVRRIYTAVKTRRPEGQVNLHQSGFMVAPTLAWATSYWDGEQLWAPKGTFPLDRIPLGMFRTEFMGYQWGVPAEFLAYVLPCRFEDEYAFVLLHDVPIRPYPGKQMEFASRVWRAMDRFGRDEAERLPYWRNGQYVKVKPQGAYVSLYRHPENGALAVVSNLNRVGVMVEAEFHLTRLGVQGRAYAFDMLSDEEMPLADGRLKLSLPSLGWKLIWIRPKAQ